MDGRMIAGVNGDDSMTQCHFNSERWSAGSMTGVASDGWNSRIAIPKPNSSHARWTAAVNPKQQNITPQLAVVVQPENRPSRPGNECMGNPRQPKSSAMGWVGRKRAMETDARRSPPSAQRRRPSFGRGRVKKSGVPDPASKTQQPNEQDQQHRLEPARGRHRLRQNPPRTSRQSKPERQGKGD